MKIMDGFSCANARNLVLKETISDFIKKGYREPCLAILQVGDNEASNSYIKSKLKASSLVGIKALHIKYENSVSYELLYEKINELNNNGNIDGIIVQLPLPPHLDEFKLLSAINYEKDVDGFNIYNNGLLFQKREGIRPATPQGILNILSDYNIKIQGSKVVVIGRSNIVGFPISKMLLDLNATVTVCHSKTKNIKQYTKYADIIVVAIGKPKFLTSDMVKKGCVVIDVGINRVNDKLIGDVDYENVSLKCSYITPVPKGIGPMTVNALLENTFTLYKKHNI
ncbi:MAG: bifunctional 5,10-methylenetetrahydrofolate dehydrogenase/5,10-methenyltetrahydrofolate cyclohydrolase [Acholeplasmatales bacterium]|jgi:methylenetetrahydrofolate dehydrogenase (NADP+)/methenyltetrahydrofolate cyclohydrolase|nr:bifunctional 5,10-methylenetetrahydrofolate dehydrogenase/5,10-methenyltetrahydrofolate cyclohydrolase [Acholeplasmatales bacterium]